MQNVLESYEVNKGTMALISVAHIDYSTIVFEKNQQLFVRQSPTKLIKAACIDGGSTFEGRRTAVCHHTGAKQKVPIPIHPRENIFAFPTRSPDAFECSWIFYHHVKSIKFFHTPKEPTIQSILTFKNEHQLLMNESHYILEKQMQRTAMCILAFSPLVVT